MNLYRVTCIRPRLTGARTHSAAAFVVMAETGAAALEAVKAADGRDCYAYVVRELDDEPYQIDVVAMDRDTVEKVRGTSPCNVLYC